MDLLPVDGKDLTPNFSWDLKEKPENVKEINLYVSVFPQGEGLLPGDTWDELNNLKSSLILPGLSVEEKRQLLGVKDAHTGIWDYNPNRILTASWKKNDNGGGKWYFPDGTLIDNPGNLNTLTSFTLPDNRTLTAGQTYYWAVEGIKKDGTSSLPEIGQFETLLPEPIVKGNVFRSVTVLTHGFVPPYIQDDAIPLGFFEMANSIANPGTETKGLVMKYDLLTGYWVPVDKNGKPVKDFPSGANPSDDDDTEYLANLKSYIAPYLAKNAPLVLLPDWAGNFESATPDSGFTEAAADAFYASLVQLDQTLGGEIGKTNDSGQFQLYDEKTGEIIRKQGSVFNSPLHFIGFSRGTVVNSEIIQRLGTFYPLAGGFTKDKSGNKTGGDLQMTTLDPHDFNQPSLELPIIGDFSDFREPKVQVWDNVTFADNYFQTIPDLTGNSKTPAGRDLPNLPDTENPNAPDAPPGLKLPRTGWPLNPEQGDFLGVPNHSIRLGANIKDTDNYQNSRIGFTRETDPFLFFFDGTGAVHGRVNSWYTATADFDLTQFPDQIYRRRGDGYYEHLFDTDFYNLDRNPRFNPWYTPDFLPKTDPNAPWEGIGTGWFYSALGGGFDKRPKSQTKKVPVEFDNTYDARMRGDFAVPTLFNGNFDVVFQPDNNTRNWISKGVPGWSFHNDIDDLSTDKLVEWSKIPSLNQPITNGKNETRPSYLNTISYDPNQPNYALELNPGDTITHNRFIVPEWGGLRFNLHVPEPAEADDQSSFVKVVLIDEDGERYELRSPKLTAYNNQDIQYPAFKTRLLPNNPDDPRENNLNRPAVDLREVSYLADDFNKKQSQANRIGFGKVGFETFNVDIPEEIQEKLIGKSATLEISVHGNTSVFLDDVFFQSEHLKFGNPSFFGQEARHERENFENNYLIEKPQYAISYNEQNRTANWVSYKLDRSWMNTTGLNKPSFVTDYSLPIPDLTQTPNIIAGSGYTQGHITPASDRARTVESYHTDNNYNKYLVSKDNPLTYLMTNLFPQIKIEGAISPWEEFEEYLTRDLVGLYNENSKAFDGEGYELNIVTGRSGSKEKIIENQFYIDVPKTLWKAVLVLEPGQDRADVTENTVAFAFRLRNDEKDENGNNIGGEPFSKYIISVNELESKTGYDFFSDIPKDIQEIIENNASLPSPFSAPLKANQTNLPEFFNQIYSTSSSKERTRYESSIGKNSLTQKNISTPHPVTITPEVEILASSQIGESQVNVSQSSSRQIASMQSSSSQIGSLQKGISEIYIDQIGFDQINIPQIGTSKISLSHTSSTQSSTNETSLCEVNFTETKLIQIKPHQVSSAEVLFSRSDKFFNVIHSEPGSINSGGLMVLPKNLTHNFAETIINELNNSATKIWSDLLQSQTQLDIDFQITNLPKGQLAEATITGFDENGTPNAGTIFIDSDANGVGWFVDSTPLDNSEFLVVGHNEDKGETYLLAAAESEASDKYDLLTTVLHELAHLYGFIDGYQGYSDNIETKNSTTKFIGDDFTAILDGEHLDKQAHPYDLLNTHLAPGERKLPSQLDVEILQAILGEKSKVRSQKSKVDLDAALTSDPLKMIANGDFSITDTTSDTFAWTRSGDSNIEQGQAILSEDSPFLSNFTQTFTVPEEAKTLQFTLVDTELGATELAPPDAFEVALLDANTHQPLTTDTNLSNTDSLLNIQNDGTTYFSNNVRIGGATSGEIIDLDKSRTITVDISHLTPGTEATLYFDLLGFGEADSKVVIDDVQLSDQNLLPPTAVNDTAITLQGQPITINLLNNDSDDDGVLQPDSIQVTEAGSSEQGAGGEIPLAHGTVKINNDGTVAYTPGDRFVGEETFTYTIQDNDGQESNPATVNITVNNASPTITNISLPDNIIEGTANIIKATATDPGNDELTYAWSIDDQQLTVNTHQLNYTFPDNGTYTGKVTVTDTYGGSDTQTFEITVNNAEPKITQLEGDTNINEGEVAEYSAIANEKGTDELNYTWDFGDGSDTVEGESVSHVFADNGEYTVTLTVKDDDGASTSQTLDVTVNNVTPVISELTGDTEINEGEVGNYRAIASDNGNDNLTYSWNFGDGSDTVEGNNVTHTFADNGNYTVTLTVTDDDGATTSSSLNVTVNNVTPTITSLTGDTEINEGEVGEYSVTATDPGDDELNYTWNFGDGTPQVTGENATHTFANNGTYDATVTVEDDDGATATQSLTISVNNVPPTINTESTKTGEEGTAVEFMATISAPGTDNLIIAWDFGDGSEVVASNYDDSPTPHNEIATHTYTQDGTYTATVSVTDSDGAITQATIDVTISNVIPVIESITGDTKINEGDTAIFSAIATDAGDDELIYTWDFGDGNQLSVPSSGIEIDSDRLPVEHIYSDNGSYTLTLTVEDGDGGVISSELNVTVNNVAPEIAPIEALTGNEGQAVEFNFNFSDPGILDTHTVVWNFGDDSAPVTVTDNQTSVTHTYGDNDVYTATVSVTDNDGATSSQSVTVTIANVAPTIAEINGAIEVNEGETVVYSAIASDAGNDELTYIWNFGDDSEKLTTNEQPVSHTYTDDGAYTIELTVTDSDGGEAISNLNVTVNNVAPVIESITGDTEINEGNTATFNAIASDAGNDELTYTWNFGDGSEAITTPDTLTPIPHTYTDNGDYTVTLTVTDTSGDSTSGTHQITVNNTAPVITSLTEDLTINEGDTASLGVTATDAGDDELTYAWDFGDGTNTVMSQNVEHLFVDNGLYETTVTITDDDGASVTQNLTITVNNVAPILDPWLDETATEGDTVEFNLSFNDPGSLDTHTLTWDFGDDSEPLTTNGDETSVSHTYTDNGVYTASVIVTDSNGASSTNTMTATVNNAAPAIASLTGDTNLNEGKVGSYSAIASDPGNDTLTYTWNFGDGSDTVKGENVTHVFADNGNYKVTLTVTDDDGAATSSTLNVFANNVPPQIVNLTHSELLEEGRVLNFNVTATDVANDPLTLQWNFGDGSAEVTGASVTHRYNDDGNYTVTVTATDDDGGITSNSFDLSIQQVFNIKAEGIVTINGNSDLDGEPSRSDDDTRIYAGKGFNLNGNLTLPVQRDAAGNEIRSGNKLILVDRAVTVAPGYLSSNASSNNKNKYANLIPPQVIEPLTVNVPDYNGLVTQKLSQTIPAGTPTITFNTAQNPLNNSNDWQKKFPASGSTNFPTVVRVIGGGLNISSGVNLSNYVIKVDSGDINFNGSGHNLTNVILQTNNGNINLAQINANNLTSFASGSINTNSGARFVGNSLLASANPNGSINFNGATTNVDSSSNLKVISSGNLIFNGAAATRGELVAGKNLTINGNSDLYGEIAARGNITINGGINLIKLNPTPVSIQSRANSSPTLTSFSGDTIVTTNTPVNYQAVVNDVDSRSLDVTWNFSDGSQPITQSVNNSTTGSKSVDVTHTFTTEGTYPVTATVNDGEGGTTSNEVAVTVDAPVASLPEGLYDLAPTGGMAGLSQVGGKEGSTVELSFNLIGAEAEYESEVGVLIFENSLGQIGELLPGNVGYVEAALSSSNKQILFEAGQKVGTQKNLTLTAGQYVMFYLVQDDSSSEYIAHNNQSTPVFFSAFTDFLNLDKFNHFQTDTPSEGELRLAIEDLTGGGDEDFNDVVLSVTSAAIVIPGQMGKTVDASVTLTGKEAVINSEIGLLILDDRRGRINNLLPTDAGYATAALSDRAIPLFSPNSAVGRSSRVSLEAGKYLGIYLIAGGTISDWLLLNSGNLDNTLPQAFFSTVLANPDGINHVNRKGNGRFALEDLWSGGDRDFDDASIQIRFD